MGDDRQLVFQTSLTEAGLLPYGLQDVEQVRLLLGGGSAIDWRRLAFRDHGHVDEYLRLAGFRLDDAADADRLWHVHARALDYLERNFGRSVSEGVSRPDDVRDLFLLASQAGPAQSDACMTLKVMHVIHHVDGRDLLFRMPVAVAELFHRVETRVFDAVDGLKSSGVRVVELSGSRKTTDSVLTKLLARRETLAADVHDKLRFRVVTAGLDDLFRAVVYLTNHLFPFNYVVPGASRNDLIDFRRTIEADPGLSTLIDQLQDPIDLEENLARVQQNVFSAAGFKMINFVVDMPVRVDDLVRGVPNYRNEDGVLVFVLVEFQLMDRITDRNNNTGDNRHSLYKARQHEKVLERLVGREG